MAAACRWGVESGKLIYASNRGSSTCPWYTVGGKMSDKNLEQQINIKFCVKIGTSASEALAL
jgi:hypothetical protein